MTRTYASLEQSLALAKYYVGKGVKPTDVKANLEVSKYQVRFNGGTVLNFDYRIVEAMVYAIASCAVVTEPKPKRKAKAQ